MKNKDKSRCKHVYTLSMISMKYENNMKCAVYKCAKCGESLDRKFPLNEEPPRMLNI